jgi:hypothetical protein
VQMNALMGFVADALIATILDLELDRETEVRTVRAFNKLLWLQNDLITRHYQDARQLETVQPLSPSEPFEDHVATLHSARRR